MRISDWSSDVCSSDLTEDAGERNAGDTQRVISSTIERQLGFAALKRKEKADRHDRHHASDDVERQTDAHEIEIAIAAHLIDDDVGLRSEEHTSELQSLMRISYAVFCLKKKIEHTCRIY